MWDAKRVNALRETLDLSQEGLARTLDVSLGAVQKWCQAKAKPSRLARRELEKLAKTVKT